MEREVEGGIGMGNTCKPMAVSFQCMTKSTTNKKKKERKKIITKKNKFFSKIHFPFNLYWFGITLPDTLILTQGSLEHLVRASSFRGRTVSV